MNDFAPATIEKTGRHYTVRHGGDDNLNVRFYLKAVQNNAKSQDAGRPIFSDKPYVEILIAGDPKTVYDQPVQEEHKRRFHRQWEAFEKQQVQVIEGTPLEEWPILSPSQVREFKALNIFTVENFAALTDGVVGKIMGGRELQNKARKFLEVAREGAQAEKLSTALAERDARLAEQAKTMETMAARLAALEASGPAQPMKKKPGPKPKPKAEPQAAA